MTSEVSFRNPYPIPDVSTEGFWIPPGPILGDKVAINDRRWAKKLDIHERLFAHHTLNSIRKNQRFVRTKAPNDALDFALTSAYVHNEDTLVPKMYVSMQPESLGVGTWRVLRNELKTTSPNFGIPTTADGDWEFDHFEEINEIEGQTDDRGFQHDRKILPAQVKMAAKAKTAARGKKMAGTKMEMRGKTSAGARKPAKPPLGTKISAGHRTETRAKSAPVRSFHATQSGKLHQYVDKTIHDGLPDRIETIYLSTLKLAIEGPHSDQTKAGYSRKEDGTFYGI